MRKPSISLIDAEEEWLDSLTLSDTAVTAYRGEVGRLSAFCAASGVLAIRRVRAKHWAAYVSCLTTDRSSIAPLAKPLKPSSALQAVRITRSFLLYCARRRWIDWDPAGVELSACIEKPHAPVAMTLERLPEPLRRVLGSESFAEDIRQARRHFALGLGFWGVLAPREIAKLRVKDLHLPSRNGSCELHCGWRPVPVVLPREMKTLWSCYRDFREESEEQQLQQGSPLIANLRNGEPLHPWSVWALMRPGDDEEDDVGAALNPQLMRKAYIAGATSDAIRDLDAVRMQSGKPPRDDEATNRGTHRSTIDMLHKPVLAKLAA